MRSRKDAKYDRDNENGISGPNNIKIRVNSALTQKKKTSLSVPYLDSV